MKYILNDFALPALKQVPIIHLNSNTITTLSYISVIVAFVVFLVGGYQIYKKRKYGVRILFLSFLFLINPIINLVLN